MRGVLFTPWAYPVIVLGLLAVHALILLTVQAVAGLVVRVAGAGRRAGRRLVLVVGSRGGAR